MVGPPRATPRELDHRERVPGAWIVESNFPMVGSSRAAPRPRWLDRRERLPIVVGKSRAASAHGNRTIESIAPMRLDRRERLSSGWTVNSRSPVAGPSIAGPLWLDRREQLPGSWTIENSSRCLDRREQITGGWTVDSSSR